MRPGCLKETHFIKGENVQARKSSEKENLSYKTTSVQALCKHIYQKHTWVLLGCFFSPSLERQYFIQIFIHMFPFFQKQKTSKVPFTGCGNILDKEILEILSGRICIYY